jgi:hypothetical protein
MPAVSRVESSMVIVGRRSGAQPGDPGSRAESALAALGRCVRLGVVGGGGAALIGPVHRVAVRLDDLLEIPAGVHSYDPSHSLAEAARLGIPRGYAEVAAMLAGEAERADGIDAVAIMAPNDTHGSVALAASPPAAT